jgi:hypothetical protein
MDAAYRHGLEQSRKERLSIEEKLFGPVIVYRRIPEDIEDIAAGYSSDDEQAAFGAGWIDGVTQSPGMMRKAIEGNDYQPELN